MGAVRVGLVPAEVGELVGGVPVTGRVEVPDGVDVAGCQRETLQEWMSLQKWMSRMKWWPGWRRG